MSAVLRGDGVDFDVDRFCAETVLELDRRYRRGEAVFPASQPAGRCHERSGVTVLVSDAEFEEFPRQIEEAIAFLRVNAPHVKHLRSYPGVEHVTLDFGIARRNVLVQCEHFPEELIRLAGDVGIGLELSQYPPTDEAPDRPGRPNQPLQPTGSAGG